MKLPAGLTSAAYGVGWSALTRLPEAPVRAAFDAGAAFAVTRNGTGVQRLHGNLARVVAATPALHGHDVTALTRAGMRSYARYWQEVFRLPATSTDTIVSRMHIDDEHLLRAAHASGRGTILVLPHMGNWDHAGAWLVATGIPFTTVAERLEPAEVFDRFVAFREGLGMEVIPLTGGTQPPFGLLADRLRAGRALCLLADRDLSDRGMPVQFFGATATMPAGPALLALRTGATLLPVTLWYDRPAPWNARIHPPIVDPGEGRLAERVARMTQQVADVFAGAIAEHPQDWHMLSSLWQADLDPTRAHAHGRSRPTATDIAGPTALTPGDGVR